MNRFRSVHRKAKVTKQDFRDGPFGDDLEVIFARNLLETIRRLRLSIAADEIDEAIRRSVTLAVQALDETFRAIDIRPLINTMTEDSPRSTGVAILSATASTSPTNERSNGHETGLAN